MPKQKLARILAQTVPLVLEIEEVPQKLELKLAWTMRAVIRMECKLRSLGSSVNILQNPGVFWTEVDCTKLAIGIWACTEQEQPEYIDEDGLDVVTSYIVPENYPTALAALKDAFLESLSKKRREEILAAEAEAERQEALKAAAGKSGKKPDDPTLAPVTSSPQPTSGL